MTKRSPEPSHGLTSRSARFHLRFSGQTSMDQCQNCGASNERIHHLPTHRDRPGQTLRLWSPGATYRCGARRAAATGELTALYESRKFERGAIFEFADRASALAWHDSSEYRARVSLRGEAMNCSLVLIG
jgi:uncharacterized protein (DUF1330 family)